MKKISQTAHNAHSLKLFIAILENHGRIRKKLLKPPIRYILLGYIEMTLGVYKKKCLDCPVHVFHWKQREDFGRIWKNNPPGPQLYDRIISGCLY